MLRPWLLLWAGLCFAAPDIPLSKGNEHFYNLEYDQAIEEYQHETVSAPDDPVSWNHLAQGILYREMLRGGALESELVSGSNPFMRREKLETSAEAARVFDASVAKAMALCNATLAKNADDIHALYAIGVTYGLKANYNFLVRKAWIDSLRDATAARKAHNRVVELRPDLLDARLAQGAHDYIVGSLPWQYRVLGFVAGIRGDREGGIKTLQMVSDKGHTNIYDARVILAAIYRRERKPELALPLLQSLSERFPRNYLFRFEMVQMYSDAGDKESALAILEKVETLKKNGSPGFVALAWEKIYYYRGNLLFWYNDLDLASVQLGRAAAVRGPGTDLHTELMALMRLGQVNDLRGRRAEAVKAYKQAIAVSPQSDVAKESRGYLSSPYRRS